MRKDLDDNQLIPFLLFLAIVAFYNAVFFIYHVKPRSHRLIVRNAFRVRASYDTAQFIGELHFPFFYHFVVADNIQLNTWSHYCDAVDFVVAKKLVGNLYNALDRKSTRLNSSHANISYAVFCLKKKKKHY